MFSKTSFKLLVVSNTTLFFTVVQIIYFHDCSCNVLLYSPFVNILYGEIKTKTKIYMHLYACICMYVYACICMHACSMLVCTYVFELIRISRLFAVISVSLGYSLTLFIPGGGLNQPPLSVFYL